MWAIMLCLAATCSASDGISGMPRSMHAVQIALHRVRFELAIGPMFLASHLCDVRTTVPGAS